MRVLVCGDRDWGMRSGQIDKLNMRLAQLPREKLIIIEGKARGADTLAFEWAFTYLVTCLEFPAEWQKYGRRAGVMRNQQILDEGKPELVIAFHPDIAQSKGTKDMIARAKKAGIPVELIT